MTETTRKVALGFIARSTELKYKGLKRDNIAIDYVCGAHAAVVALQGEDSADAKALRIMAYMVSLRGYGSIESYAKPQEAPAVTEAAA